MWSDLLQSHGYWILAVGCLLEGESVLVLAGFAAHRGLMAPVAVVSIAALAAFAGDEFFFWLGRRHGDRVLRRWPELASRRARVQGLLERWHEGFVIGVRFAYGLRIAGPILLGLSTIPARRFAALNAFGAVVWALAVFAVGWFFGAAAETFLGDIQRFEGRLLLALVGTIGVTWIGRRWWRRRSRFDRIDRRP